MIAPTIFQVIFLPSVAVAENQVKRADFCQCNAEVCENTDPLVEMRSEEDEDINESF